MLMSGDEEIIGAYVADLGYDEDTSYMNLANVIEEQIFILHILYDFLIYCVSEQ